jgi:hypothetical protein
MSGTSGLYPEPWERRHPPDRTDLEQVDDNQKSDSVEKIKFEKMAGVGQYAYEIGTRTRISTTRPRATTEACEWGRADRVNFRCSY